MNHDAFSCAVNVGKKWRNREQNSVQFNQNGLLFACSERPQRIEVCVCVLLRHTRTLDSMGRGKVTSVGGAFVFAFSSGSKMSVSTAIQ
jgi:hypothetical protein